MVQSQCLNAPFFFLVRIVYTGCVLLDLPWNMSLRRSTKVDRKKNDSGMVCVLKRKKNLSRKEKK